MGQLTTLQVKNAKPGRHADGKGLYLLVKPSGSKSWVLRVQVDGRRRDYGLGSLDLVSLSEAREKALEGRRMAKRGLDPSQEWKRARTRVPTFEEAAKLFHESNLPSWRNAKHGAQWLSTLQTYAFPMIGELSVEQVQARDIESVLLPIWQQVPETARRVRQRMGKVLDYAHAKGWRTTEAPMRAVNALMRRHRQPKGKNFPAMPYSDVPLFVEALRDAPLSTGRKALEFLILTAARSGEVRGATWGEIDWDRRQWDIPAERMKMKEGHSVPLSNAAMNVLREVQPLSTGKPDDALFPSPRRKELSIMTLPKALKSAGGNGFTVHGFRSAFRDWVAEQTNFPGDWAEAALAHSVTNRVEAAYRRTKFLEQRRALMDAWAEHVCPRKSASN